MHDQLYLGVRQLNWAGTTWCGVNFGDDGRCVDYLLSRPEVDGGRIGVTGLSGGGWRTDILAALDDRIRAAIPVGWMTTGDHQQPYNVGGDIRQPERDALSPGDEAAVAANSDGVERACSDGNSVAYSRWSRDWRGRAPFPSCDRPIRTHDEGFAAADGGVRDLCEASGNGHSTQAQNVAIGLNSQHTKLAQRRRVCSKLGKHSGGPG